MFNCIAYYPKKKSIGIELVTALNKRGSMRYMYGDERVTPITIFSSQTFKT